MSQSAFSLLSNGLKFKGVKGNEKDIFKKGSIEVVSLFIILEYLKTSSTKKQAKLKKDLKFASKKYKKNI